MEDTNTNGTPAGENPDCTEDYIKALQELRSTTVPKTEYEKLRADNQRLLKTLVDGGSINPEDAPGDKRTVDQIRQDLFGKENTNIEFWTNALSLREKLIEQGERDPFLPYSHDYVPTEEDVASAERVAEGISKCIEYADGNPDIFTSELQRITVDTVPRNGKYR